MAHLNANDYYYSISTGKWTPDMKKTITFAIVHFIVAFSVVWAITGDFLIGGAVALIEPAVNTFAYYWHERFWMWRSTRVANSADRVRRQRSMTFCC